MAGLTWNRRNPFADGAAEEGGSLSRLGRELVDRLVSLGVILDLAHASRASPRGDLERAAGAVLCSHGGCRGVFDTPRNLDDDQLRALAEAEWALPDDAAPDRDRAGAADDRRGDPRPPRPRRGGDGRRPSLPRRLLKRLWEAMPPPPMTKDGLMPPGLTPGLGIEALTGRSTTRRSSRLSTGAKVERGGGRRRAGGNLLRFLRASL